MKKTVSFCLAVWLLFCFAIPPYAGAEAAVSENQKEENGFVMPCKSAILMEAETGTVLFAQNEEEALPPASVTKVMTLLLIMEAVDGGRIQMTDKVSASANACSMGGSQIFLKEGEIMTVEDLIKSVVIASANDAAVALAEYVGGSVSSFVARMNEKAAELGMEHTHFENVTGLDDTAENHKTSAKDIALMSRALIAHKTILQYSSIWMDTVRNGEFGLTNTNRLVRFYKGCTGLKTGSTSKAGFCVSVTAERDGMSLICVIMGAESRDSRNQSATELLDRGFANYGVFRKSAAVLEDAEILGGVTDTLQIESKEFLCVLPKSDLSQVSEKVLLPDTLSAPVKAGDQVGSIEYECRGKSIGSTPILASESVNKIGFFDILFRLFVHSLGI